MEMMAHDRLAFSPDEYRRRYEAVRAGMRHLGIDAFLARSPENVCYLTGYETAATFAYHCLILSDREPVMVLRRLEEPSIREYSWLTRSVTVEDHEDPVQAVIRTVQEQGLASARIGVERGLGKSGFYFWVDEYEALRAAFPKAELVGAAAIVERARLVKSAEEIELIRQCARIADAAVQAGIDFIEPGRSEDEIAAEVYRAALRHGSHFMSLPPFVLSGPRTSLPHGTWRGRRIEPGDPVYFEVSASRFRYAAALMRTVSVGPPPVRLRAMADAVIAGLEAAMAAIRPGVTSSAVDAACRGAIERAGHGDYFNHRTGYSIGLGFPPGWGEGHVLSLRRGDSTLLEPNMTFHLVPLCLIYRELGVGFSATVRVTDSGCEEFTSLPRRLLVK